MEIERKNEFGITLIALVITIIVLLILASVSISSIINNSILDKAKSAGEKYSEEGIKEKIGLVYSEYQMKAAMGENITLKDAIETELKKAYGDNVAVNLEEDKLIVILNLDNAYYSFCFEDGKIYEFIPKGYKLCKYLESTGTQYIDTNFNSIFFKAEIDGIINETGSFFGSGTSTYNFWCGLYGDSTNNWINAIRSVGYGGLSSYYAGGRVDNIDVKSRHVYIAQYKKGEYDTDHYIPNSILTIDGVMGVEEERSSFSTRDLDNYYIFAVNDNGTAKYYSKVKIYSAKFYDENDALVCNFIPCLDDKGVACMYDAVSGDTFYNQGEGTFNYELKE